jgi:hypothetical protein
MHASGLFGKSTPLLKLTDLKMQKEGHTDEDELLIIRGSREGIKVEVKFSSRSPKPFFFFFVDGSIGHRAWPVILFTPPLMS